MKPKPIFFLIRVAAVIVMLTGLASCGDEYSPNAVTAKQMKAVEAALPPLAAKLLRDRPDTATIYTLLREYVEKNPEIYGAAFAPRGDFGAMFKVICPYVYRKDGVITAVNLVKPGYSYQAMEWFTKPLKQTKPTWTKAYFDTGGGDVWMITYSIPIYLDETGGDYLNEGRDLIYGVVTTDLQVPKPFQWGK